MSGSLVQSFTTANPLLTQVNFYGATETPQAVAYYICARNHIPESIPIGRPVDGVTIELMSDAGIAITEPNVVGEIAVHTPYFVELWERDVARVARRKLQAHLTGDRGLRLPDGNLQIIGRKDDQVKIRGFRVELGEVTKHVDELKGVNGSIVLSDTNALGDTVLRAYVVLKSGVTDEELRRWLHDALVKSLPAHMIPASIDILGALPLLPNGKVDRKRLLEISSARAQDLARSAADACTLNEKAILDAFQDLLGEPIDSVDCSFVELGADSLTSVRAVLSLEEIVGRAPDNWERMSIRALAQVKQQSIGKPWSLRNVDFLNVDVGILIRALSIISIVFLHFQVTNFAIGATTILFLLSGYSLFKFQIDTVIASHSTRALENALTIIALPTGLLFAVLAVISLTKHYPTVSVFVLPVADFVDFRNAPTYIHSRWYLWFIDAYLQIAVVYIIVLKSETIRRCLEKARYVYTATAFFLAWSVQLAVLAVSDFHLIREGVPPASAWNYIPTTHLPTLLLGGLMAISVGNVTKQLLSAGIAGLYISAFCWIFPEQNFALLAICVLMILAQFKDSPAALVTLGYYTGCNVLALHLPAA